MRFGVVVFPGTNCDLDCAWAVNTLGTEYKFIWHKENNISNVDCIILPGGFSYGDYLRTGAVARFSPVMSAIKQFAEEGGLVLGICNGFQILLEAGMLPGAMLQNKHMKFICGKVHLRVEMNESPFTYCCKKGDVLKMPINHYEGNYYIDDRSLKKLIDNGQVVLRYCQPDSRILESSAPNGSKYQIAGICNKNKNIFGLMPHPERASEDILGSIDGAIIFKSVESWLKKEGSLAR